MKIIQNLVEEIDTKLKLDLESGIRETKNDLVKHLKTHEKGIIAVKDKMNSCNYN